MLTDLHKLFDALRKRSAPNTIASPNDLRLARSAMLRSVHDCSCMATQRLHRRIRLAGNHRELWALRADAYNVIARGHCQSIAAERIHDMAHLFHGWVDRAELRSRAPAGQQTGSGH